MIGIILAGGFGTRMRPLTELRPKPLLPVANRPFLEYQVDLLKRHGAREIVFATNYLAEQIEAHFGDGSSFGVAMHYAVESEPLGTGGAIRNAASLVPGARAIVLNGDILTDFDISALVERHEVASAVGTIALRPVRRPHGFGTVVTDEAGKVLGWHEPTQEEKRAAAAHTGPLSKETDNINAGIYILESEAVETIPQGVKVSVERETFPALIAKNGTLHAFPLAGYWMDIGSPPQYLAASKSALLGEVRTGVPTLRIHPSARVAKTASVGPDSCIGPGVVVGEHSRVSASIILADCEVGADCLVEESILDEGVRLEDRVALRPGAVLGPGTVLTASSRP